MSRIMTKREAAERIGISPQTVTRLEQKGEFPNRVAISPRRIGYLEHEIGAYIKSLTEKRDLARKR